VVSPATVARSSRKSVPRTMLLVTAILGAALAAVLVAVAPWKEAALGAPLTLNSDVGANVTMDPTFGAAAVVSPDGRWLAFVASKSVASPPDLYVRHLDQLQASMIPGTV